MFFHLGRKLLKEIVTLFEVATVTIMLISITTFLFLDTTRLALHDSE